jgi:aspartyl-tRNA(Asn)/glutamyl-tRNA(Gln) amidotransferase subunit B
MTWETIIGLEIHAQLSTESKIFCGCATRFGDQPNDNTCPVCLGLPGALPVLNRRAVELGARAALALGLKINQTSIFARKNYFYPDLPKGYQISQYDQPFSANGELEIMTAERDDAGHPMEWRPKKIQITRLHLEEDAGKNVHEGLPDVDKYSYIDLNREFTSESSPNPISFSLHAESRDDRCSGLVPEADMEGEIYAAGQMFPLDVLVMKSSVRLKNLNRVHAESD